MLSCLLDGIENVHSIPVGLANTMQYFWNQAVFYMYIIQNLPNILTVFAKSVIFALYMHFGEYVCAKAENLLCPNICRCYANFPACT